ncbi:endonuclease/exonuclease/phosphatase family protein [Galbibacter sp. EGI 63066]|uniref:endonuclease/exonuclease/phosphatase family protein n=1 Tax=Galbibacter sp. EGI 63066 TaxID=2993559 RepID=UPI00224896E5|nr:endonuclease/exonuclease/phosphatase family protein [Galbibacter sp. EGI 63066]MCX2682035.1 endonuclease/exonuclease/phosphatase family protein [Galbibacter sp. EGI 63066]
MKLHSITILASIIMGGLSFVQLHAQSLPIKVMTTNIRYANPNDSINIWENRKDWLTESIDFMDIDVFGAQEVVYSQLKDIVELLPEYDHIGVGREGGNEGEFTPIFYKKDKFEITESDIFWLSETPEKEASKGWDAALPRIVTWAKMKEKESGKQFVFINTHFDHRGEQARLESAKLLVKRAKAIAGDLPFIVTGDFNFPPSVEAYSVLTKNNSSGITLQDTFHKANKSYGPSYTFNGFNLEPDQSRERIDYIFFLGNINILKYHVLDGQRGPKYISDHFPIIVDAVIE